MSDKANRTLEPIVRAWLDDRETLLSLIFDEVAEQLADAIAGEIVSNLVRALNPTREQELLRKLVLLAGGAADALNDLQEAGKVQPGPEIEELIGDLYSGWNEGRLYLGEAFVLQDLPVKVDQVTDQAAAEGGPS